MNNSIVSLHEQFRQDALLTNYQPTTITWWQQSIEMLRGHFPGKLRRVTDITLERLREYFACKRAGGWTAETYHSQHRSLGAFLKWCVRQGHLGSNPLEAIKKPRLEHKLPKRISLEDARILLDYAFYGGRGTALARHRNRAMLAVMLYAGLRKGEVLRLEVSHIDLQAGTLLVHRGKGAKDRLVPLAAALTGYLHSYLDERTRAGRQSPFLFTPLRKDRALTPSGFRRMVDRMREATGIAFSPHRLRHTFATLMLEGGCDLFSLKEMMGHSRIETTMGYLSATVGHLRGQIQKHPLDL